MICADFLAGACLDGNSLRSQAGGDVEQNLITLCADYHAQVH